MAVFLTGDTHGELDMGKVLDFARCAQGVLTREDYLIILGDFGLVWSDPPSPKETERLDWLESCPWTTLFVDGNHENFDMLDALPTERWACGVIQRVRPHVIHLMRGQTYAFGGHSFFVVGGAHSVDKEWRTPHRSWWPQEVPNDEDRERIAAAAAQVGAVDYVLTHCPPTGCYNRYRKRFQGFWGPSDEYTDWLEEHIEGAFAYKRWFYGHLHFDLPLDEPHTLLFDQVFDLDSTGLVPYATNMGTCPDGTPHGYELGYDPPEPGQRHGRSFYLCSHCGKRLER